MPDFDVAESAPLEAQLAAFARATDPGDVDWANTDTLYAKPLWEQIRPQNEAIQLLSKRLAKHAADPRVAEALTRAVREQAANTIGLLVAMQVVAAGAPREALALIAAWLDNHGDDTHRVATAVQAVLHLESPTDAFATIAPLLDGHFAEAAYEALTVFPRDVDPRFFAPAAKLAYTVPDAGRFLSVHSKQPEAMQVIAAELETIAAGGNATGYFYRMLGDVISLDGILEVPAEAFALAPQILAVVESAVPHGDWRLTQPLAILAKVADAAIAQRLREVVATSKARGKLKTTLAATIAELDKRFPPSAAATPAKPKKAVKVASPLAQTLVDAGLLAERANAIAKLVRPRIELTPAKQSKHVVGATRFGGVPDLPAKTKWPTVTAKQFVLGAHEYPKGTLPEPDAKGRYEVPLAFIAQLDLATLAPHDTAKLLPTSGLLSFFARQEPDLGAKRDLRVIASAVLYTSAKATLAKRDLPAGLPKAVHYKPASIKAKGTTPLPPSTIEPFGKLALAASELEIYEHVTADREVPVHATLGWADAGYYRGIPAANEQLLLRVGSDEVSGFEWGDAAPIFFVISRAALDAEDFEKAYCVMDE